MMGLCLQQLTAAYVKVSEAYNTDEKFKNDFSDDPCQTNKFCTQLVTNGNE